MVVLALHGEVAKALPMVRLATHKLLVYVDALLVLIFLPQPLQTNSWPICRQIVCWLLVESLVPDITRLNVYPSCAWSPLTYPIRQQYKYPFKPALDTCRSRCQQMSTPLHVLLLADPLLEGDVADAKANPYECHQLGHVSVLQYFHRTTGSIDHKHLIRQAELS